MKYLSAALAVLLLSGCSTDYSQATSEDSAKNVRAVCIDGVQYWKAPHRLAVRIDPNSLNPAKCI